MGTYDRKLATNEIKPNGVPMYPKSCGKCEEPTNIAILTVIDYYGKKRCGAFSQFGHVKKSGESSLWILNSGYTYSGWVTRCSKCYSDDVRQQGRSQGEYNQK